MKKNELFMSLVCADINNRKLYVTSYTAKMAKQMGHPAAELLAQYKAMYPTYKVIVDVEEMEAGAYILRYTAVLSQRFDTTAFKKVMPDIYKAYTKQVSSRRFSISA